MRSASRALLLAAALPALCPRLPAQADLFPVREVTVPESAAGDEFGARLAVVGSHLAVGARGRGNGAVYILDPGTGQQLARIDAPQGAFQFPISMAAAGPGRLVASNYLSGGSAALYAVPSGGLIANLADPDDRSGGFGAAVASDGEVIAVSDLFEDSGAKAKGVVHLYRADSGAYLRTIQNANQTFGGFGFGNSLLISNGVLYAGAIYATTGSTPGGGEAYAVRLSDGAPLATYPDATEGQNLLGAALALTPAGLAVAPGYDDGIPYGYLYIFAGTDPLPITTLRSPGLASPNRRNDRFGAAVATDAEGALLVGTPRGPFDAVQTRKGIVYRHDPSTGALLGSLTFPEGTGRTFGAAGEAIAVDGRTIYVGAPSSDTSPDDGGRVWVYELPARGPAGGFVVR
ncbi:MAG: hypothetical protein SF028_10455 [Candidatus Sumerlaeia bacterium]|nr:hypothetical protein [Candidatus Sumerlaeia bacterium]